MAASTSNKRLRTALDDLPLDEQLDNLEACIRAISRSACWPNGLSRAQSTRVQNLSALLSTKSYILMGQERRAKQALAARETEEVVLPLDLLVNAFVTLEPEHLAAAMMVCRHFQAAASQALRDRLAAIGVHLDEKPTTEKLDELERAARVASEHITKLDDADSREQLKELEWEVLRLHQGAMMAHIQQLVKEGVHNPSLDDGEDDDEDIAAQEKFDELHDVLSLLNGPATVEFLAQHADTLVRLLTEVDDAPGFQSEHTVDLALSLLEGEMVKAMSQRGPLLEWIRSILAKSSSHPDFRDARLFTVLFMLGQFPTTELVPIRDDLERLTQDKGLQADTRKAVRELRFDVLKVS